MRIWESLSPQDNGECIQERICLLFPQTERTQNVRPNECQYFALLYVFCVYLRDIRGQIQTFGSHTPCATPYLLTALPIASVEKFATILVKLKTVQDKLTEGGENINVSTSLIRQGGSLRDLVGDCWCGTQQMWPESHVMHPKSRRMCDTDVQECFLRDWSVILSLLATLTGGVVQLVCANIRVHNAI